MHVCSVMTTVGQKGRSRDEHGAKETCTAQVVAQTKRRRPVYALVAPDAPAGTQWTKKRSSSSSRKKPNSNLSSNHARGRRKNHPRQAHGTCRSGRSCSLAQIQGLAKPRTPRPPSQTQSALAQREHSGTDTSFFQLSIVSPLVKENKSLDPSWHKKKTGFTDVETAAPGKSPKTRLIFAKQIPTSHA